jgi:hypothetical protein
MSVSEKSKKADSKSTDKSSGSTADSVVENSAFETSKAKQDKAVKQPPENTTDQVTEGNEDDATPDQASGTANNDAVSDGASDTGSPIATDSTDDVADMGTVSDRDSSGKTEMDTSHIKGALEVVANSDVGFWRCGVKFERLEKTLVLAVEADQETSSTLAFMGYEPNRIVYLSPKAAQKIFNEIHLSVTPVDLDNLIVKESE